MANMEHPTNWPDLAIGLHDRLTGRNAEITQEFDKMHVKIPSGTVGTVEKAVHAKWIIKGTMTTRSHDSSSAPN